MLVSCGPAGAAARRPQSVQRVPGLAAAVGQGHGDDTGFNLVPEYGPVPFALFTSFGAAVQQSPDKLSLVLSAPGTYLVRYVVPVTQLALDMDTTTQGLLVINDAAPGPGSPLFQSATLLQSADARGALSGGQLVASPSPSPAGGTRVSLYARSIASEDPGPAAPAAISPGTTATMWVQWLSGLPLQ